jgi:ABC-type polysaccharide/polyol phosphate transport system ATPase subunit
MITKHCQRAILLDGGRIVRTGPAEEVVAHYDAMVNAQAEL